jgi:hypothetical protein
MNDELIPQPKPQTQPPASDEVKIVERSKQKLRKAKKVLVLRGSRARKGESDIAIESLLAGYGARGKAVATLIECLNAERTYYDMYAKAMVCEPDYATRRAAACALLAYDVGEPIKRQQILTGQIETTEEWVDKLSRSPAGIAALKKMVTDAETKAQEKPI